MMKKRSIVLLCLVPWILLIALITGICIELQRPDIYVPSAATGSVPRDKNTLSFDPDYYWVDESSVMEPWMYERIFGGFEYFLYIPPEYRNDRQNEAAKLPLVVTFHGSSSKYISLGRYGRMFIDDRIQSITPCAVLVLYARYDYYATCQDVRLLIHNLLLKNACIDRTNVIAYGHSQGAWFATQMACYDPGLFRAVISGSGYYHMTLRELWRVRNVQFYWGNAQNDAGIYEQAWQTGQRVAKWCKNSIYAEYPKRGHFFVELTDVAPARNGQKETAFLDWFRSVVCENCK